MTGLPAECCAGPKQMRYEGIPALSRLLDHVKWHRRRKAELVLGELRRWFGKRREEKRFETRGGGSAQNEMRSSLESAGGGRSRVPRDTGERV